MRQNWHGWLPWDPFSLKSSPKCNLKQGRPTKGCRDNRHALVKLFECPASTYRNFTFFRYQNQGWSNGWISKFKESSVFCRFFFLGFWEKLSYIALCLNVWTLLQILKMSKVTAQRPIGVTWSSSWGRNTLFLKLNNL